MLQTACSLASGGEAKLWKASDCVVKEFRSHDNFKQEHEALRCIKHPHVVRMLGWALESGGQDLDTLFLTSVLEEIYLQGCGATRVSPGDTVYRFCHIASMV
ncbi:unnamed protein product [Symbiodinium natans]|uniref:Protein kinase domain-containing protein n=1 Tax=Symbiodinium natans TaxID=878477 RepID=A0A812M6B1_9DINO|nr:unnamed protein product [Symbiodinium natans]